MQHVILKKENLDDFITGISSDKKVMAPVDKGYNNYSFQEVKSADEITLEYIPTILPPKKYFMPQYETLLEYNITEGQKLEAIVEYEEIILFGVHTCDLAGIQCLNIVFSDRPKDLNYLIRKNKIGIIGLECNKYCDEYANCKLMDNHLPNGGYDLFFTDLGNYFFVHVNTQFGEELIDIRPIFTKAGPGHFSDLEKYRAQKREIFKNELPIKHHDIPELFAKNMHHKVWDEVGDKCLSCGNCTNVCPTCYCFDVYDEPSLDLKTGKRIRVWDSCQNEPFARVAGGENFRKLRKNRKRHRFYRKFSYPVERYSRSFCTGCGRCSRTCMADIGLKETIKELIKGNE